MSFQLSSPSGRCHIILPTGSEDEKSEALGELSNLCEVLAASMGVSMPWNEPQSAMPNRRGLSVVRAEDGR